MGLLAAGSREAGAPEGSLFMGRDAKGTLPPGVRRAKATEGHG